MRIFAPAKVNLALHVTGRRDDGYHLLDSLVVFAGTGDWLDIAPAPELRFSVSGPRARGVPADASNLVWRAADAFRSGRGAAILLDKHLPHAGGIGGGSADAGAAMRGLAVLWGMPAPSLADQLAIGADIPVCLASRPARMRGIGEVLDPVPPMPGLWLVLVNPGVEVPTGPVFKALPAVDNAPMPVPAWTDAEGLIGWLRDTRNDLEDAACSLVPQVSDVLEALSRGGGCRLARMSGSGGTCFGLFTGEAEAREAAARLRGERPDWWVAAAPVLRDAP
ncbi:4-(cytidine 5'-diphospho)-2-C-methyl-D-erythritol kinase [Roseibacterium sp. SDUM158017]|uniref:4-(cytidine 5'-diphospho)-2-C-methyl-D-erythritol kinase n=1 Tax=Roseicyclus salinarum TaxID=3036773 RepID=UPI0024154AAD|nr:4-(cytidine 5'-diphospho)-2-C-methyl-D-erythritol kinase [Roseibacterium sp. SDUM158017]MDG4649008.1 4-(cytidine 5'-diphospho)-2-C-methyl-D-erythritol kinase [Roseibacterium sp. SDUM158017]